MDNYLRQIYFDPGHEASFGGVEKLYKFVKNDGVYKLSRKQIQEWLMGVDTYTLHKPIRRKFPKSRVLVTAMDEQWQMDLVDVSSLARYNKGNKYLLTVIDILSKYAWVVPLKKKTGTTLVKAIEKVFRSGREPLRIQTDKGTEFTNRLVQSFLKKKGIEFFTTESDAKASVIERLNRTIKERMYKYFTHQNTRKYTTVLQKLVSGYNNSYHRSIKTKPILVTKKNEGTVWKTLYKNNCKRPQSQQGQIKKGDRVRISKVKKTFEKGYLPNWTDEIFNVKRRKDRDIPVYELEDDHGETIKGSFYEQEVQKVNRPKEGVYPIEKILKRRKRGKKMQYLVKFVGYPSTFNQWVDELDKKRYN